MTSIGKLAFANCTGLTSVTIPDSVTSIGGGAFRECIGLTSVTIPGGVTGIGGRTFRDCTGLTSVAIPDSVTNIGECAFYGCARLTDVYYGGTQAQWDALEKGNHNGSLLAATLYCLGDAAPIASAGVDPMGSGTAYSSTQPVDIGGKKVELQAYALEDANGNQTNYVKVRDVAAALDGTAGQFNVDWDSAVNLVAGKPYTTRNGQENKTPYSGDRPYKKASAPTKVNGGMVALRAFVLTDDAGNGSTYYKLRDLGQALGFNVGWSADKGIFIQPGVAYTAAD